MREAQVIQYADIVEVRMETRTSECNRLLAQGWVLLGIYPLTVVADMGQSGAAGQGTPRSAGEGLRYVRRLVGFVLGRRREI